MRNIATKVKNPKKWGGHSSYNVYMTHKWGQSLYRKAGKNFDTFVKLVHAEAQKAQKAMRYGKTNDKIS